MTATAGALVPNSAGRRAEYASLPHLLRLPGAATILVVVFTWMLTHYLLCIVLAPYSWLCMTHSSRHLSGSAESGGVGVLGP